MKTAKKLTALILALFAFVVFCCFGPLCQPAEAVAVVDDAIIAIIIAGLAACGITFWTTGAYNNLNDYVTSLFTEYAASQGLTPSGVIGGSQSGSNAIGQLILNNRLVILIDAFGTWLKSRFSLSNNGTYDLVTAGDMTSVSGVTYYKLPWSNSADPDEFIPVTINGNPGKLWLYGFHLNDVDYYMAFSSDNGCVVISDSVYAAGQYVRVRITDGILVSEGAFPTNKYTYNGLPTIPWYYSDNNTELPSNINMGSYVSASSRNELLLALTGGISSDRDIIRINTGSIVLPEDDPEYDAGDGAILDVGASWGETYADITGVTIPDEFSDSNVASTSITYDGESAVQDQVTDTPSQSISQEAQEYQVSGLSSVFPFCIPFDLFAFVECLAADPVAPSFDWRFYVPGIVDETITIDLAPYDTVAQILRSMELLLFCVGLAFVTRKIIRG